MRVKDPFPNDDIVWGDCSSTQHFFMALILASEGVAYTIDPAHETEVRDDLGGIPSASFPLSCG
jgi:hypothetical protein